MPSGIGFSGDRTGGSDYDGSTDDDGDSGGSDGDGGGPTGGGDDAPTHIPGTGGGTGAEGTTDDDDDGGSSGGGDDSGSSSGSSDPTGIAPRPDDPVGGSEPSDDYDPGGSDDDGGSGSSTDDDLVNPNPRDRDSDFNPDEDVYDGRLDDINDGDGGGGATDPTGIAPRPDDPVGGSEPSDDYAPGGSDTTQETVATGIGADTPEARRQAAAATGSGTAPWELQNQARQFREQFASERPGIDPGDVSVDLVRSGGDIAFSPNVTDEGIRDFAAAQSTAASRQNPFGSGGQSPQQTGRDFDPTDFTIEDDTPQLTEDAQLDIARQELEQQIEQQTGRDVTPGDEFTVSREGGDFAADYSRDFQERLAGQQFEAQQGRAYIGAIAGLAGPGAREAVRAGVPDEVARSFSPIQADEDFTVDVTEGDTEITLTESFREDERERQQQAAQDTGDGDPWHDFITGSPGSIEQDVGYAVTDPAGAVTGPPGTLEQEAGFAAYGSLGVAATGGDDPLNLLGGDPGSIESGAGDVAYGVRDASGASADFLVENVVEPTAGLYGEAAESTPLIAVTGGRIPTLQSAEQLAGADGGALDTQPDTELGQLAETAAGSAGSGAVEATVGLPRDAVNIGGTAASGAEFTAEQIEEQGLLEGGETSIAAGATVGAATAGRIAQQASENPVEFGGNVFGGSVAGAAATPFRLSRVDVPTRDGGTTAVRGARIREPAIIRPVTGRQRGRTLVGSRGYRPTLGAPSLRNVDVEWADLGTTGTFTAEAMSSFEADIFRSTASDIGGPAARQFSTAEAIQRQAARQGRADFQFDTPEEALAEARAVPGDAVTDVTEALRDVDATVFGSVATRARVEGFRQPRDIDITTPEPRQAPKTAPIQEQFPETAPRLGESLSGETATVSDVFDIKSEAEAPGRAFGGEEIKYGFESMEPVELGGIPFNPVEEELIRKAGASAFLRGPEAAGTPGLDIGPEPRRPGRADVREKDVTDTAAIGEELLGERRIREFERAYGLSDEPVPSRVSELLDIDAPTEPAALRTFRQDTRGQLGAGRPPQTDIDADINDGVDAAEARTLRDTGDETDVADPVDGTDSPVGRAGETDGPAVAPVRGDSPTGRAGADDTVSVSPVGRTGGRDGLGPSPTAVPGEIDTAIAFESPTGAAGAGDVTATTELDADIRLSPPGTSPPTEPVVGPLGGAGPGEPTVRPDERNRRRELGSDEDEEDLMASDMSMSDFLEEYQYGVADPGDVLRGEEL